jgi:hypothetical protein
MLFDAVQFLKDHPEENVQKIGSFVQQIINRNKRLMTQLETQLDLIESQAEEIGKLKNTMGNHGIGYNAAEHVAMD